MARKHSDLKPWQMILILSFFLVLMAAVFALQIKKGENTGASFLHYADQHLNILLGDRIMRYREDGRFSELDLKALGLSNIVGGFDFFPNGDLLIRSNAASLGFVDSVLVFLRVSGRVTAEHPEAILLRCSLQTVSISSCKPYSTEVSFERTFRPALHDGQLLIADTSRHRLLHLDDQGKVHNKPEKGFRFPNQIAVINDIVYVANTNRHSVSYRTLTQDDWLGGQEGWQHFSLRQGIAKQRNHIYPTEFVKLEKGLAVLSQGDGLKLGNIYHLNNEGLIEDAFDAPNGADMISIAPFKNEILASDFTNFRIYRFDRQGRYLGDFDAPEYRAATRALEQNRQRFDSYLMVVYVLGGMVFLFFLAIGIWLEVARNRHEKSTLEQEQKKFKNSQGVTPQEPPKFDDPATRWLPYTKHPLRDNKWLGWLINGTLLVLWLAMLIMIWDMEPTLRWALILSMSVMAAFTAWIIHHERHKNRARLGVLGNWLLLENEKGARAVCQAQQIRYTRTYLIAGEVYIPLMQGKFPLFDADAYRTLIEPRLGQATNLSQIELFKFLWSKKDGQFLILLVVIPLFLLVMLLRLFFST